ncbi:MAG: SpoIID/LytB domain-containing protein [Planctomycetes bacterium]|nr:SpoIID/LytB domain-containing protein [Planctomycetota bacterium]
MAGATYGAARMNADVVFKWVRGVMLLGLLAYFVLSLIQGLVKEHSDAVFGRYAKGAGQDPGVRVLLSNRSGKDPLAEPSRTQEQVELTIFQDVDVVTPDDPDNAERHLTLRSGAKLFILVDGPDGMTLSSKEWGSGGKEVRWNVNRVRVQPRATTLSPTAENAKTAPGHLEPTGFEAVDSQPVFGLTDRRYRGSAEILWKSEKQLMVIDCLPMEAYVDGVVAVEMSPSFPIEALKAQAVVSRSYAYARAWAARYARQPFDLVDGVDDQDYRGHGNGNDLVTRAVVETRGTITYTDQSDGSFPFAPYFSASSGGYTASVASVFPDAHDAYGHALPPEIMPAQADPYCQAGADQLGYLSTHWVTSDVIRPADIRSGLIKLFKQLGDARPIGHTKNLRVGRRNPQSNRVETVIIDHTLGDPIELPAAWFRRMIGNGRIRSTLWSARSPEKIDAKDDPLRKDYRIETLGYGHGVGMSQISAWEMAQQGRLATEILRFFYPRVRLVPMW